MAEATNPKACVVCRIGTRAPGETTSMLRREQTSVTIEHVPAEVCDNCGADYYDAPTSEQLQQILEDAIRSGTKVAIIDYGARAHA